jgi:hypothetical protein
VKECSRSVLDEGWSLRFEEWRVIGCRSGGGLKQPQRLEAWASQLEADLYKNGLIVSKRLDVLIGSNVDSGKGKRVTRVLSA